MKRMMAVMAVVMLLTLALSASTASAWGPGPGNVYIVQRGDTLSGIAFQFGVSMYELGRANGIFNPNLIWVGQCLTIPQGCFGGNCGQPIGWGNNWNQCDKGCYGGWNQCDKGCYGGWNQGWQGGWNQGWNGYPTNWGYGGYGNWGGYGWNSGCSTCGQGGAPIPWNFKQKSVTLENNYSTTFEKG